MPRKKSRTKSGAQPVKPGFEASGKQVREAMERVGRKAREAKRLGVPLHNLIRVH